MTDSIDSTSIDPELLDFLDLTATAATPDAPPPNLSLDSPTATSSPLASNPPPSSLTWPTPDPLEASLPLTSAPTLNPVLQRLPASQRPPETLACSTCDSAVWMTGPTLGARSYCRVMHVVTWDVQEMNLFTDCSAREAVPAT